MGVLRHQVEIAHFLKWCLETSNVQKCYLEENSKASKGLTESCCLIKDYLNILQKGIL